MTPALNIILCGALAIGGLLTVYLIDNWSKVKEDYHSWPDWVQTLIMVIGAGLVILVLGLLSDVPW